MEHPQNDPAKNILLSYLTKISHTLEAVILLYNHSLYHEAQSLIRIAFELYVTFLSFLQILHRSPIEACTRVWDSVMLEKVKQQKASGFKGLDLIPGAPTAQELLKTEKEISLKYSDKELNKLRKHGFSGLNVEQRARQAGLSSLYDIVYRNFSRNVHSTDLTELTLFNDPQMVKLIPFSDYTESRDFIGCDVAFLSAFGIAEAINGIFQLNFDRRLKRVISRKEKFKESRSSMA